MWWDHQNLNRPRIDKTGKRWNFRVWHDSLPIGHAERIFFWDDRKEHCGVILLPPGSSLHVSRLHTLINKLVANPDLREQHRRELSFPLERHYSEYGAFPEERQS
jgi:hypothetical protein